MPTANDKRQLRAVARSLTGFAERAIIKLTLDINADIVKANPVDTGWSRANWQPGIGVPPVAPIGTRPKSGTSFAGSAGQAAGQARVAGYKLGPQLFITNNVPYIDRLNRLGAVRAKNFYGRIEPGGFVEKAIERNIRIAQVGVGGRIRTP